MRRVRSLWGVIGVIVVAVAAPSSAQVAVASPRASVALHSRQPNVRLAARVITISAAFARRELIGVSVHGVFKFRRAIGPLAALRRGKVMLIKGRDAVKVIGISHSHGRLLVDTATATLTDLLSSGRLPVGFGTGQLRRDRLLTHLHARFRYAA